MRNNLLLLFAIVMMASCSAPKYAYHFDRYDYNSGKRKQQKDLLEEKKIIANEFQKATLVQEETLLASATDEVIVIFEESKSSTPSLEAVSATETKKSYTEMTKLEKREIRKEYKNDLKEYKAAKKSGDEVRAEQAKESLTGYTRMGVILIIAGLVLAILSLGSVINSIGGLMVLAGVILILVDIL